METCRWSLALGVGLLVASMTGAGIFIGIVSGRPPHPAAVVPRSTPDLTGAGRSALAPVSPGGGSSAVPVSSP
jgi:hypothetical protein